MEPIIGTACNFCGVPAKHWDDFNEGEVLVILKFTDKGNSYITFAQKSEDFENFKKANESDVPRNRFPFCTCDVSEEIREGFKYKVTKNGLAFDESNVLIEPPSTIEPENQQNKSKNTGK